MANGIEAEAAFGGGDDGAHKGRRRFYAACRIAVIVLAGLISYSNTFDVPFQWDDRHFIKGNPAVRDCSFFTEPGKAAALGGLRPPATRVVGYLTFALNYKLHGLRVGGYHAVNLAIHLLNALLFYALVLLLFKTPLLESALIRRRGREAAFFSALVFAVHPVQTEAVTYIFQRLASLAAFFYLGSLVLYARWRLRVQKSNRPTPLHAAYLLSLAFAVLAMKTKENAFTLPLTITLFEFIFMGRMPLGRRVFYLAPFLLTLLLIPLGLAGADRPVGEIIGGVASAMRGAETISRGQYLLTELRVLPEYLRLMFVPIDQNIAYDLRLSHSFFDPPVFLSFLFLSALLGLAVFFLKFGTADMKLIGFGVAWFFLTISVESSVIPIPMVMNEYRLYLPSVGIIAAASAAVFLFLEAVRSERATRAAWAALAISAIALSAATYARNSIWRSELSLWEDAYRKSPAKVAVLNNLGAAYGSRGMTKKAVELFDIALGLKPDCPEALNNLGLAYASMGRTEDALRHYLKAVGLMPDYAEAHRNLGRLYMASGNLDGAIVHFGAAARLRPDADLYVSLGTCFSRKRSLDSAMECYRAALMFDCRCCEALYNIGLIHIGEGRRAEAAKAFRAALDINPGDEQSRFFLAYAEKEI